MLNPRQVLIGIILILGISFSPLVNSDVLVPTSSIEPSSESSPNGDFLVSDSNWNLMSGENNKGFSVNELSGQFNLAHGSFDPITEQPPTVPTNFIDNKDYDKTGMKFIQFHENNYQLLMQLEQTGHLTILDLLGDGNFVVRFLQTMEIHSTFLQTQTKYGGLEIFNQVIDYTHSYFMIINKLR